MSEADPNFRLAALCQRLEKRLTGFSREFSERLDGWSMEAKPVERKSFPIPELILLTLRNLMGWQWTGAEEKTRWTVYGSIDGEPIGFSLRKFGLRFLYTKSGVVPHERVFGQLRGAIAEVEEFLKPIAEAQIHVGDVHIANHFSEFRARYEFFRELADQSFKRSDRKPRRRRRASAGDALPDNADGLNGALHEMTQAISHKWRHSQIGFFHSTAMVEAWFSALEHRLILLRAFTGRQIVEGELLKFLAMRWDEKLKATVPIPGNRPAELLLGRLRRIRDRVRNPFAHGGVENDGGSLFFHIPHVGAVPANLSRFGDSVRFSFLPIEVQTHEGICRAFDEADGLLAEGALAGPHRLLDTGIHPSFDSDTLAKYRDAIAGGEAALERFIERWHYEDDRHTNMDY